LKASCDFALPGEDAYFSTQNQGTCFAMLYNEKQINIIEEITQDIVRFEDGLRMKGHVFPFQARIEAPHGQAEPGVFHLVSWLKQDGEWRLYYSIEQFDSQGTQLLEHKPVLNTKAEIRACVAGALDGLERIAKARRYPVSVPMATQELTDNPPELSKNSSFLEELRQQMWRFKILSGMKTSAQNIEVAGSSVTAPIIIQFLETVAQDFHRLGARGDETIYIHDDIGMKAEMAGIHDRVGTIDALYFYFDEEGYHISADYSPEGIEGLLKGGGDVNDILDALPDYLVCRLQPKLQHIVFCLLTRFYGQTSVPKIKETDDEDDNE
jgi:hypothetical protein